MSRSSAASTKGPWRALRSRNFSILWAGNLLANTGSWMQQVAEPWLVLRLSGSSFLLGVDSFVTDAPVWALILVGGLIADRYDRRRTALLFQGIQVLCPVALVVLLLTGGIRVWLIIALSFIVGVTDALSGPSINAIVPASVPEEDVPGAVALNSAQFNLSRVLGPLLAGVVMATLGPVLCFALNAASYVPYLGAIALLRLPRGPIEKAPAGGSRRARARASLLEAVRAVLRKRRLRRALLTVFATSLFGMPTITFMPVLVRDALHLGSAEFGGALSSFGLGGLVGAAGVLPLKTNRHRQLLSSASGIALGGLLVGLSLGESYRLLLGLAFLCGAAMVSSNTAANSVLQSSIDGRIRGRVSSLYTLALRGGAPVGSLLTGLAVSHVGVRTALFVNGALAVLSQAALVRYASRNVAARPV